MKNTKKILTFLIAFILVASFTFVDAATYKDYKRGDKIDVKLNPTTTGEFYILADSDATNDKITAVYETTVGDAITYGATANGFVGSNAETTLNNLTSTWNIEGMQVRLLTAQDIKAGINFTKETSEDFTEAFLMTANPYWLGDVAIDGEETYPGIVNYWNTYSSITVAPEDTTTAYIKPVITIAKEHLEGGVVEDPYITEWNKYVEIFKDNEYLNVLKSILFTDETVLEITHTDTTLTAKVTEEGETFTTNFTYQDGIMTYVEYTGSDDYSFFDQMMIANAQASLAFYKDFDLIKFSDWVDLEGLTLEKDGIEVTKKTIVDENENGTSKTTFAKSFKIDIMHDFATFKEYAANVENTDTPNKPTEDKTTEKNPSTGLINYGTIALAGILVAGTAYVVVRKKNKLPHA